MFFKWYGGFTKALDALATFFVQNEGQKNYSS
jgi:hypothetical protein